LFGLTWRNDAVKVKTKCRSKQWKAVGENQPSLKSIDTIVSVLLSLDILIQNDMLRRSVSPSRHGVMHRNQSRLIRNRASRMLYIFLAFFSDPIIVIIPPPQRYRNISFLYSSSNLRIKLILKFLSP